ncbi:MAG: tetratricopeptide repeat protein [Candidatus Glassbacteria bacterium]|nr:tetratricopeptide repeat protein [Candidatus Glassbacteria bacterium]
MLKRYLQVLIFLCATASLAVAAGDTSYNAKAVRELLMGYEQFIQGNHAEAAELIGRACDYDKNSVLLKVLYARVLFNAGRYREVIGALRPLLDREDSLETDVYGMLAVSCQETGDKEEAIGYYKLALKYDPDEKWARRQLLDLLNQESRFQEMIPVYKPLLDPEEPGYAVDLYQLGAIYLKIGGQDLARECLEQAVQADSALAEAHRLLGNLYEIQGRWNESLEHYLAYLELSPDEADQMLDRVLAVALRSAYPAYSGAEAADTTFASEDSIAWRSFLKKIEDLASGGDSLNPVFSRVTAIGYEALGQPDRSVEIYREILARQPGDKMSRRGLLRVLNLQGRYQEMIEVYQPLLVPGSGNYARDLFQIGQLFFRTGQKDKAGECFEKCVAVDSMLGEGYLLLGNLRQQAGQWKHSQQYYLKYLRLNPGSLPGLFDKLLLVSMRAADFESPIVLLEDLLEEQDDSDPVREQLGTLYYHADRFGEALELLEPLAEREALSANGYYTLGFLYSRLERPGDALEAFNRVRQEQPDFTPVYLVLGRLYFTVKDLDGAEEVFSEGLERTAGDDREKRLDFLFGLVNVCHERGDTVRTESLLKQILGEKPDHAPALNYLGYFYAERGVKLKEARRLIDRALEKEPGNGHYIDSLGWVLFRMGRTEEALGYIKASLEAIGDHPEVYEHLGDIYYAQGKYELALQAWNKSLDMNGSNQALRQRMERLKADKDSVGSKR